MRKGITPGSQCRNRGRKRRATAPAMPLRGSAEKREKKRGEKAPGRKSQHQPLEESSRRGKGLQGGKRGIRPAGLCQVTGARRDCAGAGDCHEPCGSNKGRTGYPTIDHGYCRGRQEDEPMRPTRPTGGTLTGQPPHGTTISQKNPREPVARKTPIPKNRNLPRSPYP